LVYSDFSLFHEKIVSLQLRLNTDRC